MKRLITSIALAGAVVVITGCCCNSVANYGCGGGACGVSSCGSYCSYGYGYGYGYNDWY